MYQFALAIFRVVAVLNWGVDIALVFIKSHFTTVCRLINIPNMRDGRGVFYIIVKSHPFTTCLILFCYSFTAFLVSNIL